jgi:hypothetical protein
MPEPSEHTENRPLLETILRKIPGFRGYLEKEYRRDSDDLQRQWLADRLQRSKRGLDDYARTLAEAAQLDTLPQCDRLRRRLDKLIGRIRSAMEGYSGVFDLVQIDEAVLDQVYAHDVALVTRVEALATDVEALAGKTDDAAAQIAALLRDADDLEKEWDEREDILRGLE